MTDKPSTQEPLTLFQGDFLASHSAQLAEGSARKMIVISGRKCCALLTKQSRAGSLVKMLMGLEAWESPLVKLSWKVEPLPVVRTTTFSTEYTHDKTKCLSTKSVKTLKKSDTTASRLLFQLAASEHRIDATASGLLPTIVAADAHGHAQGTKNMTLPYAIKFWQTPVADDAVNRKAGKYNSRGEPKLSAQVLFPTPTAREGTGAQPNTGRTGGKSLRETIQMYPTPVASDWNGAPSLERINQRKESSSRGTRLPETLAYQMQEEVGGQLNPAWVEWLMGFPIGWTDLQD